MSRDKVVSLEDMRLKQKRKEKHKKYTKRPPDGPNDIA